jgi:hypothetical protein
MNYLLIKTKLNNNGVNMPKSIQFKTLLLLMLLFSSSTNVFSQNIINYIDHKWQDSRYIDHKNGTVTDTKTALMWKQCPEGFSSSNCGGNEAGVKKEYTYKTAIEQAEESTFADYHDWRLPNIKELISLVAYDRVDPYINSTLFPYILSNERIFSFLSSSPNFDDADEAWRLNFSSGVYSVTSRTANRHYVRLVRGRE